jgi:hypothetical protein
VSASAPAKIETRIAALLSRSRQTKRGMTAVAEAEVGPGHRPTRSP